MSSLIYGLITGIVFGFLMQRGQVIRYDKQIGALRLKDMTILKFMLTAILVGSVGIYLLTDLGLAKLSVKATVLEAPLSAGLFSAWAGASWATARPPPWGPSARDAGTECGGSWACWSGPRSTRRPIPS